MKNLNYKRDKNYEKKYTKLNYTYTEKVRINAKSTDTLVIKEKLWILLKFLNTKI